MNNHCVQINFIILNLLYRLTLFCQKHYYNNTLSHFTKEIDIYIFSYMYKSRHLEINVITVLLRNTTYLRSYFQMITKCFLIYSHAKRAQVRRRTFKGIILTFWQSLCKTRRKLKHETKDRIIYGARSRSWPIKGLYSLSVSSVIHRYRILLECSTYLNGGYRPP